ncbi:MAG: hypothetical protein GPJ54_15625 [Candidatus Heimdallarchaeota archaeon]|nr:hypothetical protein [Candidatus Heimdallarchaeota archaeon]
MTTIAIPIKLANERKSIPSSHFGRSPQYYIIEDIDDPTKDFVLKNTSDHFGGTVNPTDFLRLKGVNIIIAGGMGQKAIDKFSDAGIAVFKTPIQEVDEIIDKYRNEQLSMLNEGCSGSNHKKDN